MDLVCGSVFTENVPQRNNETPAHKERRPLVRMEITHNKPGHEEIDTPSTSSPSEFRLVDFETIVSQPKGKFDPWKEEMLGDDKN